MAPLRYSGTVISAPNPDPELTTVSGSGIGEGPGPFPPGVPLSFLVATYDAAGVPRAVGGATVSVTVADADAPALTLAVGGGGAGAGAVEDLGDGTYAVSYTPPSGGDYVITVHVDGGMHHAAP